jgi:hypothetical protein
MEIVMTLQIFPALIQGTLDWALGWFGASLPTSTEIAIRHAN